MSAPTMEISSSGPRRLVQPGPRNDAILMLCFAVAVLAMPLWLDPIGAAAFDRLTLELKETLGLTVFLITHDLDTLHEICDRVAVIADKKVIAVDTVPNLMELDHPWIQEYFNGPRGRAALTAQALDELRKHMDEPVAAHAVKALDKPPAGKA